MRRLPSLTEHVLGSHVADCAFTLRMLLSRTWPRPRHCARSVPHWASLAPPGGPGGGRARPPRELLGRTVGTPFRSRARAPVWRGLGGGPLAAEGRASVRGSRRGGGTPAPAAACAPTRRSLGPLLAAAGFTDPSVSQSVRQSPKSTLLSAPLPPGRPAAERLDPERTPVPQALGKTRSRDSPPPASSVSAGLTDGPPLGKAPV